MAISEQIKTDLQGAMRAGEKERVGALRMILSELQKAAKEGGDDELAVLRRERKRRLEAAKAPADHDHTMGAGIAHACETVARPLRSRSRRRIRRPLKGRVPSLG